MKIIGSKISPFVRYTRAMCKELNLQYDFHEVPNMSEVTEEELAIINDNNPAMKVPILQDNGKTILDSRVIINYLLNKAKGVAIEGFDTQMTLEKENHLTILYAAADAALIRFLVSKTHANINMDEGYMKRSLDRIDSCLTYLNSDKDFGKTFGTPELWSIFLLQWFSLRGVYDWSAHSKLAKLYEANKSRIENL